ncbi:TetR/AcrR family transcriptional regulator [Halioxenophilus aromaticivorans]|uniref:HTH tetR-type domain-containing protein n=1 Tax=Halioxenophilus aromaticivorans TaxID=1306992 RepID=A0AAV3U6Y5_9ALTE
MPNQHPPPKPRKAPKQSRSQHMVSAILDACLRILTDYGEEALTLTLLEKISGAGKGSIYQYFPNLEAIVAALYQRECHRMIDQDLLRLTAVDERCNNSLESLLETMITLSVKAHDRLRRLHSSFHERYSTYFDIGKMYGEDYGVIKFVEDIFVPLAHKEYPEATLESLRDATVFALHGMQSQYFTALAFYPNKIYEPHFSRYLVKTGLWILNESLMYKEEDTAIPSACDQRAPQPSKRENDNRKSENSVRGLT